MNESKSADEQPKKKIAKRVVTPKRKYFFPESGVSVDAEDSVEASKKHKTHVSNQEVKEGDV